MKKILMLFTAVFLVTTLSAQPKWSIKAIGGVGASINSGTYASYYYKDGRDYHYDYDEWDDIYDNSDIFFEAGLGFRFYVFKWVYLGADVSYSQFKNSYDLFYTNGWTSGTIYPDKTLKLDGISVSVNAGFAFHNRSKFYPFAEVGLMPYFTFNDDFHDKSVYFGTNFKLGGGYKLTEKLAIELAFSSTMLYKGTSNKNYYNDTSNRRYSKYSAEINSGIGGTIGCIISF